MRAPGCVVATLLGACTGAPLPAHSPATPASSGRASAAETAGPPAGPGATAVNLAVGVDGDPLLTWIEPATGGGHRVRMSRLSGGRWNAASTIAEGAEIVVNSADVPSVAQGDGGAMVAHWAEASGAGTHIMLARSSDRGVTWQRVGPAHADRSATEHGFVSIVPEEDGGASVVWLDGRETANRGATGLRVARGGKEAILDKRVCDCCPTAAVMTSRGPVVFYRDRLDDETRDISVVRRVDRRWSPPAAVARDGWTIDACPVSGPAAAARGNRVAVAWHTEADGTARVLAAFSSDSGATFEAPVEIDRAGDGRVPSGRVAIALDEAGSAVVTWLAARGDQGVVVARRAAPGGALGAQRVIAPAAAGRATGTPRLARVGSNLLLVWVDAAASQLVARTLPEREVGATAAAFAGTDGRAQSAQTGNGVGRPAPAVAAVTLEGKPVTLASRRGKVVLINVWATWCAPCKEEFPILADLQRRHAREGLEVIAISIDVPEAKDRVRAFIAKHKPGVTVWLDPQEVAGQALQARNLPVTILVDRGGVVRFRRDGLLKKKDPELARALADVLQLSGP